MEVPWLALGAAAILLGQQNLLIRALEEDARRWHSDFVVRSAELEASIDELAAQQPPEVANKNGMKACTIGLKDSQALVEASGIDLEKETIRDTCVWLALLKASFQWVREYFPAIDAGILEGTVFYLPAVSPLSVVGNAQEIADQLGEAAESYKQIDDSKMCRFDWVEPQDALVRKHANPIKEIAKSSCLVSLIAWRYYMARSSAKDAIVFGGLTFYWPIILVIGLCFRVGRTVAEYHLDRISESKSPAASFGL